jgi:PPP family 3-phenylpropionic acid transporter
MSPAARLRLFYFLYYGGVGAFLPYFAPYLRGLGFSGREIGAVQMVAPLVAAPAALGWAAVADRIGSPTRALRIAALWAAATIAFLPFARTPWTLAMVLLAQSLAASAVVPLVDSVAVEWVQSRPGHSYARIRLFGSLGFVALAQGLGLALAARGDRPGDVLVPLSVVACVAGYALLARHLPTTTPPPSRPSLADVSALLHDRRLLALLGICALHWAGCAPFHLFYGVLVRDHGLTAGYTGLGMSVGVGAEIAFLLLFPRLEGRLSLGALFAVAFAGTSLRWVLVSRADTAATLVGLQALHGLTFGLFWGTAVKAMSIAVPSRLRATGQALFSAVVFAGGNAAGYGLSGAGYDRYGSAGPLFAWAAALELVPLAMMLAFSRRLGGPGARAAGPAGPPSGE